MEDYHKDKLQKHEKASRIIGELYSPLFSISEKLREFLDSDDPVWQRFDMIENALNNLIEEIENEQKNGTPISF